MSTDDDFKIKFGIRTKLLFPIVIGLVAIISILLFIWQPSQLEKAKQDFINDQTDILKTLNPSLLQNILSNDLSALHSILENSLIIHQAEWRYIQITNTGNKKLYPIFKKIPEATDTLLKIKLNLEENDDYFGQVLLYTDWKAEKLKQMANINRISLWSIFLFTILAIISFIIQTKLIYTPITNLKDLTSELSHGDYLKKLPKVTSDEIGSLTASIDKMRNKIQFTLNELVDKELMQRAIVESAPDAIITMNAKGIVKSFNPGAEKIFQYSAKEVIGHNVNMLMPEEVAVHHDQYLADFEDTRQAKAVGKHLDIFGQKKDSSLFPIELTINTTYINDELLFTGILRDITERKKVERLKDEFVSTVSHELRTPLTAIKGSLDLITHGINVNLPEQASIMLDVANRNVDRLLTLINDILDISKLESGEIDFQLKHIEIKPFIENCIELNHEYATKYNTDFICTKCIDNIYVNADKNRLTQVMSNLLSNAAKYSPENVNVEIFTSINNDKIRISVKDFGPGIPEEFQNVVFEKFTQSSSGDTRQVGGTGLGLNISKMIIEKMGGEINFDTIQGKETTFYFELPIIS